MRPLQLLLMIAISGAAATAQNDTLHQVSGRVVDPAGSPVVGARVCAYPVERGPSVGARCSTTGNEGSFVIATRTGGRHLVMADDMASGRISQMRPFYRAPRLPVAEVLLGPSAPAATVTVVVAPPNGTITARVIDEESGWAPDAVRFVLCHAEARAICHVTDERREDGVYALTAPHVPFVIDVLTPSHERLQLTDDGLAITVASGEHRELTIRLQRRPELRGVALLEQEKQRGIHLPPPVQVSPADGARLEALPDRLTPLQWQPVPGAVSYTVEVDVCAGGRAESGCHDPFVLHRDRPLLSGIIGTSYPLTFVGAQPGRWRVYAVDAEGRAGFKSPWRGFEHLR